MTAFEDDLDAIYSMSAGAEQAVDLVFGETTLDAIKNVGPTDEQTEAGIEVEVDQITAQLPTHNVPSTLAIESEITLDGDDYRVHEIRRLPPDGKETLLLLAEA
jgi:hypothetical protein